MPEVMRVSEVVALLMPMFREMLHDDELASLRLEVVPRDHPDEPPLEPDDLVESNCAAMRWWILGERGWSGSFDVREGPVAMVRAVQSDLQDFIAESGFGWGELRGPTDLP
ncbi:hypothetical protein J2Y89_002670 [Curtobacterium herbarum]|uniref:hypothetical protein n=1 Tax=Curtobacterium herbarum TaxID=150122 RepID=UPI00209E08A0|nr:hypothetical protein [Curtobacterium herbarum]MCP1503926.1 hypothetical protein [Curtobacterium herbarum]